MATKSTQGSYDWDAIRQEYVTGPNSISTTTLSEKYGMAPSTIRRRCAAEDWVGQRKEYRNKVDEQTADKLASIEAERRVEMLDLGDDMVAVGMITLERLKKHLESNPEYMQPSKEMRMLLKDGASIIQTALGIQDTTAMSSDEFDRRILQQMDELVSLREAATAEEVDQG